MPRKPAQTLPAFTPVPRLCDRSNGWKPEVQRAFIEALADTGSVKSACRRVGRSDNGAYQLRRHPEAGEFRKAWDAACDIGLRRLEDVAMERALEGVEEQHTYHDKVVLRRRYDNRLLMFLLRNRAPHRFAEGGGARGLSAVDRQTLKRHRKQWRKEWEEERKAEARERTCDGESFLEQLEQMHRRWYAALSGRARRAYRAFRRIEAADREAGYWPGDDEIAEAEAEYAAGAASLDGRAKINLLIEADAIGVDEVLAEDEPDPPPSEEPDHPEPQA